MHKNHLFLWQTAILVTTFTCISRHLRRKVMEERSRENHFCTEYGDFFKQQPQKWSRAIVSTSTFCQDGPIIFQYRRTARFRSWVTSAVQTKYYSWIMWSHRVKLFHSLIQETSNWHSIIFSDSVQRKSKDFIGASKVNVHLVLSIRKHFTRFTRNFFQLEVRTF